MVYFVDNFFFTDIGANLTDAMYQGLYNGSRKHEADLANVLARSNTCGVDKIIITGTSLEKSKDALSIAADDGDTISQDFHEKIFLNLTKTIAYS